MGASAPVFPFRETGRRTNFGGGITTFTAVHRSCAKCGSPGRGDLPTCFFSILSVPSGSTSMSVGCCGLLDGPVLLHAVVLLLEHMAEGVLDERVLFGQPLPSLVAGLVQPPASSCRASSARTPRSPQSGRSEAPCRFPDTARRQRLR